MPRTSCCSAGSRLNQEPMKLPRITAKMTATMANRKIQDFKDGLRAMGNSRSW